MMLNIVIDPAQCSWAGDHVAAIRGDKVFFKDAAMLAAFDCSRVGVVFHPDSRTMGEDGNIAVLTHLAPAPHDRACTAHGACLHISAPAEYLKAALAIIGE